MSGSGRKHVSKWDSKEEDTHHHPSVDVTSGSHYRDKDPQPVLFNADSNANASRRSVNDQHSGQARTRSRASQNNDNSYYFEQDETRQQLSHRLVFRVVTTSKRFLFIFVLHFLLFSSSKGVIVEVIAEVEAVAEALSIDQGEITQDLMTDTRRPEHEMNSAR